MKRPTLPLLAALLLLSQAVFGQQVQSVENLPEALSESSTDDGLVESVELRFSGADLHFLVAGPENGPTVLLLHGARYDSSTWNRLGTLRHLAKKGYRVLALDLPGYGKSGTGTIPREKFLAGLLPLISDRAAVIVSPSMSGAFSLPLLVERPSYLAGFVAVAPGGIPQHLEKLRETQVPILAIWGEDDTVIPKEQAKDLEKTAGAKRVVLKGAGHASYLAKPIEFHAELVEFLEGLKASESSSAHRH